MKVVSIFSYLGVDLSKLNTKIHKKRRALCLREKEQTVRSEHMNYMCNLKINSLTHFCLMVFF